MSINIWTDSMQHAALLGKPVLFTNWLIQRDIIPDGWYCYDLRGTHKSPSTRTTLVDHAADYHAGTVLSPIPLKHEGTASRRVNGTFYLLGEEMTLEQFCEEHDLAYPQDNREFVLRPASLDEVGLFYSEEKLDEALGRKAADPSIPHTYAWFVMADTNTPQEIIRQDLTLEEAIQIYQDSNTSEKRLGVIKDGIATVDFVHFQSGEQQFFTDHEKLESFRSDLVVAEAMERLYQQLNQPDIGIRMGEM